jgi:hypothetical protein
VLDFVIVTSAVATLIAGDAAKNLRPLKVRAATAPERLSNGSRTALERI